MSNAADLDQLVDWCTVPIRTPNPGGRDLANEDIADGVARRRHQIVQAFQDSRNADWGEIYRDGLGILREYSNDLYALWAALAPLPVVKGCGLAGIAASIEVCTRYLDVEGELWDAAYPKLPGGLLARTAVLSELAQRWTRYVTGATFGPSDAPLVRRTLELVEPLIAFVEQRCPETGRPRLGEMHRLLRGIAESLSPSEDEADVAEAASIDGVPIGETRESVAVPRTGRTDEITGAYLAALGIINRQPQVALDQMTAAVERQALRDGQFRGRVYLGDLYLRAGHVQLARQLLEFLDDECGQITLQDWEPELCGTLWATLHRAITSEYRDTGNEVPQGVTEKLRDLFAKVCRVDPKQATTLRSE